MVLLPGGRRRRGALTLPWVSLEAVGRSSRGGYLASSWTKGIQVKAFSFRLGETIFQGRYQASGLHRAHAVHVVELPTHVCS